MLTAQEKARILAKIRKDSYGITLEQMKQYFIEHQHAREIGDKKMMEKIEYHLTYINPISSISTTNAACWPPGSMISSRRSSKTGETSRHRKERHEYG